MYLPGSEAGAGSTGGSSSLAQHRRHQSACPYSLNKHLRSADWVHGLSNGRMYSTGHSGRQLTHPAPGPGRVSRSVPPSTHKPTFYKEVCLQTSTRLPWAENRGADRALL